jgi:hypothetical protein
MNDTTKIVIVVLVAVVVLFVLGLGVGRSGTNDGQGGLPGVSVDGVKNALIGSFPTPLIPLEEVTADPSGCLDRVQRRIEILDGGDCELTISPSDATVRSLKLQIASGASVRILMTSEPVEGTEMDIDAELPGHGSNQTTLTFFASEESQTVEIEECTSTGTSCTLTILE